MIRLIPKRPGLSMLAGLFCACSAACSNAASTTSASPGALPDEPMKNVSPIKVRLGEDDGKFKTVTALNKVVKTDEQWKKQLTDEEYKVARGKGTEPAFCGLLTDNKEPGVYSCVCCGLPLFTSDSKFHSGTGWPSFFQPVAPENVVNKEDHSYGMDRVEILCARCDAHLGHVFEDGPKPTGLRYCLNSVAMKFTKKTEWKPEAPPSAQSGAASQPAASQPSNLRKAAFGAGCFWGVQDTFDQVKGVVSTTVGYSGGRTADPTYKEVCTDTTGHAETLLVEYDPSQVSYEDLLQIFWENHDPTTLNRQGPDVGEQYRSVIFYYDDQQKAAAAKSLQEMQPKFKRPIVTQVVPAAPFYPAEEYHQKYLKKHGLSNCHVK